MNTVKLNTGALMPIIGLGTFQIKGSELIHKILDVALRAGYRSIDTAGGYRNEEDIGKSLKEMLPKYNLKRSDVFITSKLPPKFQGKSKSRESCLQSLKDLQCDYLDLYLIHWPGTQGMKTDDPRNVELRKESWLELEQLCKEGKLKAIGVSNYMIPHLEELLKFCSIKPALLQIEHHPYLNQKDIVSFCKEHDIAYQAYSSLGSHSDQNKLKDDPVILELAKRHQKTPAQILLRWAVQQDIGVLPRSTNTVHVEENFNIFDFDLPEEDITKINSLDQQLHYCWDPRTIV
ncbi:glyoxal reductase-like [Lineus longissimus]|uniref:glyoxal reductase-like n=1 Tax=Lineus longissimus TaxID=88925 RepID=UPI002B4F615A